MLDLAHSEIQEGHIIFDLESRLGTSHAYMVLERKLYEKGSSYP
jgi:hypothetical protein